MLLLLGLKYIGIWLFWTISRTGTNFLQTKSIIIQTLWNMSFDISIHKEEINQQNNDKSLGFTSIYSKLL